MDFLGLTLVFVVDILWPVLFASVTELVRERRGGLDPETGSSGQVALGSVFAVVGGFTGFVSAMVFRHAVALPEGASLILSPLGTGLAMHFMGIWRRQQGSYPSILATFWGGALFGLAAAIVRFLVIQYR